MSSVQLALQAVDQLLAHNAARFELARTDALDDVVDADNGRRTHSSYVDAAIAYLAGLSNDHRLGDSDGGGEGGGGRGGGGQQMVESDFGAQHAQYEMCQETQAYVSATAGASPGDAGPQVNTAEEAATGPPTSERPSEDERICESVPASDSNGSFAPPGSVPKTTASEGTALTDSSAKAWEMNAKAVATGLDVVSTYSDYAEKAGKAAIKGAEGAGVVASGINAAVTWFGEGDHFEKSVTIAKNVGIGFVATAAGAVAAPFVTPVGGVVVAIATAEILDNLSPILDAVVGVSSPYWERIEREMLEWINRNNTSFLAD